MLDRAGRSGDTLNSISNCCLLTEPIPLSAFSLPLLAVVYWQLIPWFWVPAVSGCSTVMTLHLLGKFTNRVWQSFNSWDHWKAELQEFLPSGNVLTLAVYWALVVSSCPYSGQSWQSIGFFFEQWIPSSPLVRRWDFSSIHPGQYKGTKLPQ